MRVLFFNGSPRLFQTEGEYKTDDPGVPEERLDELRKFGASLK